VNRILLKKSLAEARGLLLGCLAALLVVFWSRVWLVTQFDMSRFKAVLEQFREYQRFSPVPFDQLFTYAGRIAISFDEPVVIVCIAVWAIARGSDCVSGELGRGTLEMLLAQPISRTQVLWSQAAVTIGGVAALAWVTWLGLYLGIHTNSVRGPAPRETWTVPWLQLEILNPLAEPKTQLTPLSQEVDPAVFAPAACNLFALGVFLAGLSCFLSACDRYRWRTIGLMAGLMIAQMIIKVIGVASDRFHWLMRCTFLTAYEPQVAVSLALNRPDETWSLVLRDPAGRCQELGPLGYDLLLIGLGVLAYAAATFVFRRRDLPAPL
jgi:ABC-2 type transport system permease protein